MIKVLNYKKANYAVNVALLILVATAWVANKYPEYAGEIAVSVVLLSLAVSGLASLVLKEEPLSQEPELTSGEIDASDDRILSSRALSTQSTEKNNINVYSSSALERSHNVYRNMFFDWQALHLLSTEVQKPVPVRPFFDLTPSCGESYVVRIGLVTVIVEGGKTEIKIDAKDPPVRSRAQREEGAPEKIDVLLRPELRSHSWPSTVD